MSPPPASPSKVMLGPGMEKMCMLSSTDGRDGMRAGTDTPSFHCRPYSKGRDQRIPIRITPVVISMGNANMGDV